MTKLLNTIKTIQFIDIIVCIAVNFTMKPTPMRHYARWKDNESAWKTAIHGNLACFSMFIRDHLFSDNYGKYELIVMDRDNYSKPQFFGSFWQPLPSTSLYPIKVIVSNNYNELLSFEKYQEFQQMSWLTKEYHSIRYNLKHKHIFYIGADIPYPNYKQLAVYLYTDSYSVEHLFILPLNYYLLN